MTVLQHNHTWEFVKANGTLKRLKADHATLATKGCSSYEFFQQ